MQKKKLFTMSIISMAAVITCAAFAITSTKQLESFSSVKAADSWTEKAYVAPTGNSVGYKHYYLGCPGNYRTSDAEHLQDVSLEDITIPQLNVIDRSAVDSDDGILNVSEAKIRYLDQTTTLGQDPGTAVFVSDAGHNAVFFSRSNELGDDHYSEFRFLKNCTNLTSITFEYRYLDFNESHIKEGDKHSFFEIHTPDGYQRYYLSMINDDAWHTMTIPVREDTYETADSFLFNIYEFQGHCYVSNLQFHGFDDLNLEPASTLDAINPITISDLGITSGTQLDNTAHIIKSYDYLANNGIDLWLQLDYSVVSGDNYFYFYLFNQENEDGAVFRFIVNRTDDDGIVPVRLYANSGAGNTGTDFPAASTLFYFPRRSGIKSSQDVIIHVSAVLTDAATNTFEIAFTAGIKGGEQWYPNTNAEASENTPVKYHIELGANYFADNKHNKIRFSCSSNAVVNLNDAASEEVMTVYKDAFNNVVGKTSATTLALPNYTVENKTLVAWFDLDGNRVTDGQTVNTKLIIRPIFVDTQSEMRTLKDFGLDDRTYEADCGETISSKYFSSTNNRVDIYFTYNFESSTDNDNWFTFGFPYDGIDGYSRLRVRINNTNNKQLNGYISGGSLGGEGGSTAFSSSNEMRTTLKDTLFIHCTIIDEGNNAATLTIEFTNLATGATFSATRNVTFSGFTGNPQSWGLDATNAYRNKFGISNPVRCAVTLRSVF